MSNIRPVSRSDKCVNDSDAYYERFYGDDAYEEEDEEEDEGGGFGGKGDDWDEQEQFLGSRKRSSSFSSYFGADEGSRLLLSEEEEKGSGPDVDSSRQNSVFQNSQDRVSQFLIFLRHKVGHFFFEPFSFFNRQVNGLGQFLHSEVVFQKWSNFWGDVVSCSRFYQRSRKLVGFLDFSDRRRNFRRKKDL